MSFCGSEARLTLTVAALALTVSPLAGDDIRGLRRAESESRGRQALVIGNADYSTGRLNNPLNDARDMAGILEELGFTVELLENAGHQAMEQAVRAFGRGLGPGDVGLFYFAGHGLQQGGENFLIPVGARIESESEIPYKSVQLDYVLGHMDADLPAAAQEPGASPDRLNIVILDACRDNPFRNSLNRGFANRPQGLALPTDFPKGTIIAYATSPGKVAADGTGRNGIFTEHLLEVLKLPGLSIEEVLKRTRQRVAQATGHRQWPWTSSSLVGDFIPRAADDAEETRVASASLSVDTEGQAPREPHELDPAPPPENGFSLQRFEEKALAYEESRAGWTSYFRDMHDAFERLDAYEERNVPAGLKAEAWAHFLDEFESDNPYSPADDSLRSQAESRRDLWAREAARIAAGLTDTSPELPAPASVPGSRWRDPLTRLDFRYVAAGDFCMGSPRFELGRDRGERLHDVALTHGFWIAETEVTQRAWSEVMGNNPSYFSDCGECPVERVSWYEAIAFANLLSKDAGLERCYELSGCRGALGGGCASDHPWCPGDYTCLEVWYRGSTCEGYRLPSEAEWEYAARAGSSTAFWTGDVLALNQANIADRRFERLSYNRRGTVEVATFGANPWGLHDVHGNVLEWTWDAFGTYPSSPVTDPEGPWDGNHRVARGGGWSDTAEMCRSASRRRLDPANRFNDVGLRLVRSRR